jgi:hypothetical protein
MGKQQHCRPLTRHAEWERVPWPARPSTVLLRFTDQIRLARAPSTPIAEDGWPRLVVAPALRLSVAPCQTVRPS